MYDDVLMHHGIKGQKWGVRRYQNADGSLTPRGKSRYSKAKDTVHAVRHEYRSEHQAKRDLYDISKSMTDEELQTRIKRLQTEKQFRDLAENDIEAGRSVSYRIMSDVGDKTAKLVTGGYGAFTKEYGKAYGTYMAEKYGRNNAKNDYERIQNRADKKKSKDSVKSVRQGKQGYRR